MTQITEKIEYWGSNLKLLEGLDRFQYIIEQARMAKPMNEKFRIPEFQIHGCASKLWVVPELRQDRLFLTVDSDAFITKGTAAIIADIFDGQSRREIGLQFIRGPPEPTHYPKARRAPPISDKSALAAHP